MRRLAVPEIFSRLPPSGHVVIEASAGTGKTYTLEHLVLTLILRGQTTLDRILVCTFTDRAAQELAQRVRGSLQKAIANEDDGDGTGLAIDLDEQATSRVRQALLAFDDASIVTIHSFCQRLLSEHAFASKRAFEEELVDPRSTFSAAFRRVFRRALAEEPIGSMLLDALAHESVQDFEQFLFDVFKERGELVPKADLEAAESALESLPDLQRVRAEMTALSRGRNLPTPTIRAVEGYLKDLWQLRVEPGDRSSRFRTWADEAVNHKGVAIRRLDAVAGLLDGLAHGGVEWRQAVAVTPAQPTGLPTRSATLSKVLSSLSILDVSCAPFRARLAHALLPRIRDEISQEKLSQGMLDFDDMLAIVASEIDGLRPTLRERYSHVLIDEFQDTDDLQWGIFKTAFFEPPTRLILVGDPKQAIYGFRNADVFTYHRAVDEVRASGGAVVPLLENFRSTPRLLACVHAIIGSGFFTGANQAGVTVRAARASRLLDEHGHDVPPVVVSRFAEKVSVADLSAAQWTFMAREILAIVGGSLLYEKGGERRGLRFRDVQVLTRTLAEGESIAKLFVEAGIPHAFHRPEGLFQGREASAVHQVLLAIDDPSDRTLRARAYLSPFFEVPLSGLSSDDARGLSDRNHDLLVRWRDLGERRQFARLFASMIDDSGLAARLTFRSPGASDLQRFRQILEALVEESEEGLTLSGLVRHMGELRQGKRTPMSRSGNEQRAEQQRDAVQILTMHKSKGLEAPIVFVAGGFTRREQTAPPFVAHELGQRMVILTRPSGSLAEAVRREWVEEAERLMYVAMTRAEARLYLVWPPDMPSFSGVTSVVSRRLSSVVQDPSFDVRDLESAFTPLERTYEIPRAASLDEWVGPEVPSFLAEAELDRLRKRTRMRASYSRLVREEEVGVEEYEGPRGVTGDELPGGRLVGILLHSLLEHVDFAGVREEPDADAWLARKDVRALLVAQAREHRAVGASVEPAARLVHRALRSPVHCLDMPEGLCCLEKKSAEVSLVFPIPEEGHPRSFGHRLDARRGVVVGSIDLAFHWRGREYFLDWKSDRLSSYELPAMEKRVRDHYALQATIYSEALIRAQLGASRGLAEMRYGGAVYAFLRGMKDGQGVFHSKPSGAELDEAIARLTHHAAFEGRG